MSTTLVIFEPDPGIAVGDFCARLCGLADVDEDVVSSRAEVLAPGVVTPEHFGAGSVMWEVDTQAAARTVQHASVRDVVTLAPLAARHMETTGPLIKRTLLLRVRAGTPDAVVERFEADLAAMPDHISTIRSWRLSRVVVGSRWTHAWEQEYASLDGLTGEYMLNPFHWTTVDAWFDAEVPDHIVEPELAHLFAPRDVPWSRAEL